MENNTVGNKNNNSIKKFVRVFNKLLKIFIFTTMIGTGIALLWINPGFNQTAVNVFYLALFYIILSRLDNIK